AIMALFPGSPRDAVQAGVELQQSVYDFNLSIKPARWPEVRIGIGVHCGTLMLGAIGANQRMDVTVISDAVNIASRLEQLNKYYHSALIVSEDIAAHADVRDAFMLRQLDRVRLYGRQQPLLVYDVLQAEGRRTDALAAQLGDYRQALDLMHSGDLAGAAGLFEVLYGWNPADRVVEKRLQQLRHLQQKGISIWDGVIDFGKL
ncbi:MAG: adenylate/guanylate cyclase domain-containing protein, partial [Spirochaetes bacterium]|nr:adenylate/guanylate cyclase domain-containing protein [Spirochaetota bacterium]